MIDKIRFDKLIDQFIKEDYPSRMLVIFNLNESEIDIKVENVNYLVDPFDIVAINFEGGPETVDEFKEHFKGIPLDYAYFALYDEGKRVFDNLSTV